MKKIIFNISFLVILLLITAYKNQKFSNPEKNKPLASTYAGVYFCEQTKEVFVVEGNDKAVKKIYYAKGKSKFKAQKVTSQKKIASDNPLGEDYEVSFMGIAGADKLIFGNQPSGKRYLEQKSKKGKENTAFYCISSEINIMTSFSATISPNILISRAFAGL